MVQKKEFYFLRHGQTDHAFGISVDRHDIELNACGRQQAHAIKHVIASLPIKTVCFSPLIRAKETKEIVASNLQVCEREINDLTECNFEIWSSMTSLGERAYLNAKGSVKAFMERVRSGINQALSEEGPVLIVAHGGIHWATCCLMGVEHEWAIDNCIPVHFTIGECGQWKAKKLI